MGLLNYITATSLDEDYAAASRRRTELVGAKATSHRVRGGVVVLVLFGLLVATAAVETARNATQAARSHNSLVAQINDRKAELADQRKEIVALRAENTSLEDQYLQATRTGRSVRSQLDRLGVLSGALPVRGAGVRIVVDDAPGGKPKVLDRDLQKMVNGLWQVGAEAVSVNGQRLSNLTAIRQAGEGITVNFRHVNAPYTVSAIGDPDTMPARFLDTAGGQTWLALKSTLGLPFDITSEDSMKLPAAPRLTLRHAHIREDDIR